MYVAGMQTAHEFECDPEADDDIYIYQVITNLENIAILIGDRT